MQQYRQTGKLYSAISDAEPKYLATFLFFHKIHFLSTNMSMIRKLKQTIKNMSCFTCIYNCAPIVCDWQNKFLYNLYSDSFKIIRKIVAYQAQNDHKRVQIHCQNICFYNTPYRLKSKTMPARWPSKRAYCIKNIVDLQNDELWERKWSKLNALWEG